MDGGSSINFHRNCQRLVQFKAIHIHHRQVTDRESNIIFCFHTAKAEKKAEKKGKKKKKNKKITAKYSIQQCCLFPHRTSITPKIWAHYPTGVIYPGVGQHCLSIVNTMSTSALVTPTTTPAHKRFLSFTQNPHTQATFRRRTLLRNCQQLHTAT